MGIKSLTCDSRQTILGLVKQVNIQRKSMADQAHLIAGARNMLRMNVKTLARVLRVSDSIITDIEKSASSGDARVKDVVRQLENYGVYISNDDKTPASVYMDEKAGRLRFTFKDETDFSEKIERFQRWLSVIGQMGWQPFLIDKKKGSGTKDSVDLFFTLASRGMAAERLDEWIRNEGPLVCVDTDGTERLISKASEII
jgi:hypothetical protein